jgi:hypothetical protein
MKLVKKPSKAIIAIFWSTVAVSLLSFLSIVFGIARISPIVTFLIEVAFLILGMLLIILSIKEKIKGALEKFLKIMGAFAIVSSSCLILIISNFIASIFGDTLYAFILIITFISIALFYGYTIGSMIMLIKRMNVK